MANNMANDDELELKRLLAQVFPPIEDGEINLFHFWAQEAFQDNEKRENPPETKKPKLHRKYFPRQPARTSPWYKSFIECKSCDRKFRRRFRLPYGLFEYLLAKAKEEKWFPGVGDHEGFKKVCGVEKKPLELLVLGSLAYLAGVASWEVIEDGTYIAPQTHRAFFEKFVTFFSSTLFGEWVQASPDEFEESAKMFEAAGLPGCFVAVGGVHVRQWSCAYNLKNYNKGKEKYSTQSFNVAALSNTKIVSCTSSFNGTWTDSTIANQIQNNEYRPDYTFQLKKMDGSVETYNKPWALVDGDYLQEDAFIAPPADSNHKIDMVLTAWMESVRKLIECVFGILKQRFRILKFGFVVQKEELGKKIFKTCCVLHNQILAWTQKEFKIKSDQQVFNENLVLPQVPSVIYTRSIAALPHDYDFPTRTATDPYEKRIYALAEHFYVQLKAGQVLWPSRKGVARYDFDVHDANVDPINEGFVETL